MVAVLEMDIMIENRVVFRSLECIAGFLSVAKESVTLKDKSLSRKC